MTRATSTTCKAVTCTRWTVTTLAPHTMKTIRQVRRSASGCTLIAAVVTTSALLQLHSQLTDTRSLPHWEGAVAHARHATLLLRVVGLVWPCVSPLLWQLVDQAPSWRRSVPMRWVAKWRCTGHWMVRGTQPLWRRMTRPPSSTRFATMQTACANASRCGRPSMLCGLCTTAAGLQLWWLPARRLWHLVAIATSLRRNPAVAVVAMLLWAEPCLAVTQSRSNLVSLSRPRLLLAQRRLPGKPVVSELRQRQPRRLQQLLLQEVHLMSTRSVTLAHMPGGLGPQAMLCPSAVDRESQSLMPPLAVQLRRHLRGVKNGVR